MSTTEITAFKAIETDLQVSMDDVVSAFVSQYENNLYDRKKQLTGDIKAIEDKLDEISNTVHDKVNGDSYEQVLPFDLKLKISKGAINWHEELVKFELTITSKDGGHYSSTIKLNKEKKIPAAQISAYKKVSAALTDLRADLSEVLVSLKSVNRKERQVRGRIAMRKLEDSGYASLMQDSELAQLVQLED